MHMEGGTNVEREKKIGWRGVGSVYVVQLIVFPMSQYAVVTLQTHNLPGDN